jgi:lactoylglutathione lyase
MEFLHTMVRVADIDESLRFFCDGLGLTEVRRVDNEGGRFTLVFLATPKDVARANLNGGETGFPTGLPMLELTYNWPDENGEGEAYGEGRNFGHVAYYTDNIYEKCQHLIDLGYAIHRPPRDGRMAFVRSPDNISVELLQNGAPLEIKSPWAEMENHGIW